MNDGDIEELLVLPRRVLPQPTPEVYPGGDCGACVLGGLLGMSVMDVYERLQKAATGNWTKPSCFTRKGIINALAVAQHCKLASDVMDEVPRWHQKWEEWSEWGDPGWIQTGPWFKYVRLGLQAGYYAIANVRWDKGGPLTGSSDHWVLLCGSRLRWRTFDGGAAGDHQILVSCSSRSTPDEEWVEPMDFLRHRGGFNVILVRPG